jgi:hypothetical protein
VGFLDPKKLQEDDELPGGSGLHLDLETKVCPSCQREALPWQTECEDCGVPTVVRADVPVAEFDLPNLLLDDDPEYETSVDRATAHRSDAERSTDHGDGPAD